MLDSCRFFCPLTEIKDDSADFYRSESKRKAERQQSPLYCMFTTGLLELTTSVVVVGCCVLFKVTNSRNATQFRPPNSQPASAFLLHVRNSPRSLKKHSKEASTV